MTRLLGQKSSFTWHFYLRKHFVFRKTKKRQTKKTPKYQTIEDAQELCTLQTANCSGSKVSTCVCYGPDRAWKVSALQRRAGGMEWVQDPMSSYVFCASSSSLTLLNIICSLPWIPTLVVSFLNWQSVLQRPGLNNNSYWTGYGFVLLPAPPLPDIISHPSQPFSVLYLSD